MEQSRTDHLRTELLTGGTVTSFKRPKDTRKENKIHTMVQNYAKYECFEFIIAMSKNMNGERTSG